MNFFPNQPNKNIYPKKVILFTNARDEHNIKEWAAHHLLIGFDLIVIFDHKSKEPLKTVFSGFNKKIRTVNVSDMGDSIKIKLMNVALDISKKLKSDWMIYLDADEFIILNKNVSNIKELLFKYKFADSLGINWLMFGSNYFVNDPTGLMIENYVKSELFLDKHVKTFIRPQCAIKAINPHYYIMSNPNLMYGIDCNVLNPPYTFNNILVTYEKSPIYIAHYVNQSEETYMRRKINLPADDTGKKRIIHNIKHIHNQFNSIHNYQPKSQYSENIKNFLQNYK